MNIANIKSYRVRKWIYEFCARHMNDASVIANLCVDSFEANKEQIPMTDLSLGVGLGSTVGTMVSPGIPPMPQYKLLNMYTGLEECSAGQVIDLKVKALQCVKLMKSKHSFTHDSTLGKLVLRAKWAEKGHTQALAPLYTLVNNELALPHTVMYGHEATSVFLVLQLERADGEVITDPDVLDSVRFICTFSYQEELQ